MKTKNFMNYIKLKKYGAAENLIIQKAEIPKINDYEVLIEVYASGVNRPDVLQRKGLYAPPKGASKILGLEVSGKIKKIGKKVKNLKINQKVCALVHGGGYAEYCKVFYKHVLPIPKGMNFNEAAAIPENFFTVWYNLFERGQIKKSDTILIHGGSSGIGTAAIQLCKVHGCKVITTVGNKKKQLYCKKLGADLAIDYNKSNFLEVITKYTKNKGVDIILDMVGQKYFEKNILLLKDKGKLIMIAFLSGSITKADFTAIMTKRLTITGSTLRPRTDLEKAKIAIATGGIRGLGPGKSIQKNFLPQSSSDFIFAIIIEEYGLIGGLLILLLYTLFLLRVVIISNKSESIFGSLLVIGLGIPIVFQAIINIGVSVQLFPITGQPLPLISSGGTSIWMTCISVGIIQSVRNGMNNQETSKSSVYLSKAVE